MLPANVQDFIDSEIAANTTDYSDLRAVFLNGTLKRSPEPSHTEALIAISRHILAGVGVRTDVVRTVDHVIPPGVQPDMREHGWERDGPVAPNHPDARVRRVPRPSAPRVPPVPPVPARSDRPRPSSARGTP